MNYSVTGYDIGYAPEINQSRWGNPMTAPFGDAVRAGFTPYGGSDYLPYQPYLWPITDFTWRQPVGILPTEYLYGEFWGYRGVLPIGLQAVSPDPYPYQLPYPYNRSA